MEVFSCEELSLSNFLEVLYLIKNEVYKENGPVKKLWGLYVCTTNHQVSDHRSPDCYQ